MHLRCIRDARALCIALRSLGHALCMWLPHMFGRSMRGSHLETETCTLELRTCCLCEKRKDPGFFFIRGPFLDALGISHRTQGMHLKCIRCFRCISVSSCVMRTCAETLQFVQRLAVAVSFLSLWSEHTCPRVVRCT